MVCVLAFSDGAKRCSETSLSCAMPLASFRAFEPLAQTVINIIITLAGCVANQAAIHTLEHVSSLLLSSIPGWCQAMQRHRHANRRRTLKSTLHSTIFWEMVKFVDLGVLYVSLVLPRQSRWTAGGREWTLRAFLEKFTSTLPRNGQNYRCYY